MCDTDNDALRSDKLYLYYTQLGRCAYTGRRIEIDELFDNNIYDVDHIYPRSKTADDSMDNRHWYISRSMKTRMIFILLTVKFKRI